MNLPYVALFAALIGVSGFFAVPVGPMGVPIVFQNLMVVLAGLLLGPSRAVAAVLLWLLAGALGLPVFSAGRGGFAYLMGPTGGFFPGYVLAALLAGLIAGVPAHPGSRTASCPSSASRRLCGGSPANHVVRIALAALLAFVSVYPAGVAWFMFQTRMDLGPALLACCVPYLPGDLVKLVLAVLLACRLRPRLAARFSEDRP